MINMKWSCQQLFRYTQTPLKFSEELDYREYIKGIDDILDISTVKVEGEAIHPYDDRYEFKLLIKCTLFLQDAVTLEQVEYPIDLDVTESFDKIVDPESDEDVRLIEKNTIDLYDVVWENIYLEKPIRVTKNR